MTVKTPEKPTVVNIDLDKTTGNIVDYTVSSHPETKKPDYVRSMSGQFYPNSYKRGNSTNSYNDTVFYIDGTPGATEADAQKQGLKDLFSDLEKSGKAKGDITFKINGQDVGFDKFNTIVTKLEEKNGIKVDDKWHVTDATTTAAATTQAKATVASAEVQAKAQTTTAKTAATTPATQSGLTKDQAILAKNAGLGIKLQNQEPLKPAEELNLGNLNKAFSKDSIHAFDKNLKSTDSFKAPVITTDTPAKAPTTTDGVGGPR